MRTNPKATGARLIRHAMSLAGLPMKRLADAAGISPSTLSRGLNEDLKDIASTQTLQALADYTEHDLVLLPRGECSPYIDRETERAELRLAVAIAAAALIGESCIANRLPHAVDEVREWLIDQRKSGTPIGTTEEGLLRIGTLAKNLGRVAPAAST